MKLEFGLLSVSAVALLCLIAGGIVGGALRKGCIYQACQIDVLHNSISLALELYHADHGSYPTPEQGLSVLLRSDAKGPYLSGDLTDPWGQPVRYSLLDGKPVIGFFSSKLAAAK